MSYEGLVFTSEQLETLTIDELIDLKVNLKKEMVKIQEYVKGVVDPIYRAKVNGELIEARIKAAGLEGIVVVPETAVLGLVGN